MINKLIKLITDEIPEILELKRGCFIHTVRNDRRIFILRRSQTSYACYNVRNNATFFIHEESISKIIGRPITLADVLRVLEKSSNEWVITGHHNKECIVIIKITPKGLVSLRKFIKWNLEKPLEEQEPETIEFLYNLLK